MAGKRLAAAAVAVVLGASHAAVAEPALIALGVGAFDAFRDRNATAAEFRIEYRSGLEVWILRPFAAFAVTTDASTFVGGGVLAEATILGNIVLTASFAPMYYARGNSKVDLDYPLQFRSQGEIAWRFASGSRLGVAVSHVSNGGAGDTNTGAESVILYYSLPIAWGL